MCCDCKKSNSVNKQIHLANNPMTDSRNCTAPMSEWSCMHAWVSALHLLACIVNSNISDSLLALFSHFSDGSIHFPVLETRSKGVYFSQLINHHLHVLLHRWFSCLCESSCVPLSTSRCFISSSSGPIHLPSLLTASERLRIFGPSPATHSFSFFDFFQLSELNWSAKWRTLGQCLYISSTV